jgi:hypothetical protein
MGKTNKTATQWPAAPAITLPSDFIGRVMGLQDCLVNFAGGPLSSNFPSGLVHVAFANVGMQLWARVDSGVGSNWILVWEIPNTNWPSKSESGIRGLTCITDPAHDDGRQVLLMVLESDGAFTEVWRVDPASASAGTGGISGGVLETILGTDANAQLGTAHVSSMIIAYNSPMVKMGRNIFLGGSLAWDSCSDASAIGHSCGNTRADASASYWIRTPPIAPATSGSYCLYFVPLMRPFPMNATRAVTHTEFTNDDCLVYTGGGDIGGQSNSANAGYIACAMMGEGKFSFATKEP